MRGILNLLTLGILAVLAASLVVNWRGTVGIINAVTEFMSRTYAAELGVPTISGGTRAAVGRPLRA